MTKTAIDLVKAAKSVINEVSLEEAATLIDNGVTVLDVRDAQEFDAGHINSAVNISRGTLEFKIDLHPQFEDKSKPIIVVCKTGGRSALATAVLQELGFTNPISLAGGFDAWSEKY